MSYIECLKCKGPMIGGHRSGICVTCRTVKCAEPECDVMVVKRLNDITFCKLHSGGHERLQRQKTKSH